ncbi:MAG: lamin tail domain-containing protein [Saprospiraceae bacterium]|nr:lamin tail domain-containing protein [Saprospiraceae bacterium]
MNRKDKLSFHTVGLIKVRYFLLLSSFCLSIHIDAQLKLDFQTPFPGSTKWEGNISNFKINTEGQLQLIATEAGESSIFTKYKIPDDSIRIDLYFKLQFAPSADNFGKIYLFVDKTSEVSANGYYLKMGENGSNDAVQLWKLTSGKSSLLGSGKMGAISADPADARLLIKIYRNGLWVMQADYDGKTLFEDDMEVFDPLFVLPDSMYFGIYCKYTATRTDKFFYDDISIKTIDKDTIPPDLSGVNILDANTVQVVFSEPVDEASATKTENYNVNNGLNIPAVIIYNKSLPNQSILKFSKPIISGINYILTINGVKDKSNNTKTLSFPFSYNVRPDVGDLVISEVLTDPYTGGDDFVELYNKSTKFISLDSIGIKNAQKSETKIIITNFILQPGKYVAISKNTQFLTDTYLPPDTANFISATLPSLNVESANISIISFRATGDVTVDSFDYNEKMHFGLIDNTKGVSLEGIKFSSPTNDANNWHSSSSQNKYATPGYKNSNYSESDDDINIGFTPDKKIFTPNGDGHEDFVLITYKTDKPGYLATMRIFDTEGFPVYDLANNYLLGTEGDVKWDGRDNEGNIVRTGMYLIFTRIFHPDGDVKEYKSVVVAADNF